MVVHDVLVPYEHCLPWHKDPSAKFGWDKKKGEKEGKEVIMAVLDSSPVAPFPPGDHPYVSRSYVPRCSPKGSLGSLELGLGLNKPGNIGPGEQRYAPLPCWTSAVAGLKPCTRTKCSCTAAGLACTSYCFCNSYNGTCCNPVTHSQ